MTTYPDRFRHIRLESCGSTNDHIRKNLPRLESDFPLMVSAGAQTAGRGRESRGWFSPGDQGVYATFGFHLAEKSGLPLLSIAAGIAACDMLQSWTGKEFALKWPNDILADGKKIAGILCETIIQGDRIVCLAGIGINVNQLEADFPPELRQRAGSLKMLTGADWPVADGLGRLAASMSGRLAELESGRSAAILRRAGRLSRRYLGREIAFHHQGRILRGTFRGLAADGGLRLQVDGRETAVFYSGEWLN